MQAIEVKHKIDINGNSKIIASCSAGKIIAFQQDFQRDASLKGLEQGYETYCILAAKKLVAKLEWGNEENYGQMVAGTLNNGHMVFVFLGKDNREVIK